jgi:hypothetical protein
MRSSLEDKHRAATRRTSRTDGGDETQVHSRIDGSQLDWLGLARPPCSHRSPLKVCIDIKVPGTNVVVEVIPKDRTHRVLLVYLSFLSKCMHKVD